LLGAEALVRDTYLDTARAVTDVLVCVASREDVDSWLRTREQAGRAMLELVVLAQCSDAPRRSSSEGSAEERVASWLLEQGDEGTAALPRHVVAGLLGMLPETLSRALASLASRGLVAVSRKHVEVLDAAGLEQLASGARDSSG
jgi:CRP-like cAMP-binding protein